MRLSGLNWALLVALALVVGLNLAMRPAPTRRLPNFPLSNMDRSAASPYDAPNPAFDDGKTVQQPPAGTLAVDQETFDYGPSEAEAVRAGYELRNPIAADEAALARGQAIFATYCAVCHGPSGLGDGTVTRRGVPAPVSLLSDTTRARADGEIYHIITEGRRTMPGYATQIEPADRWRAVAFVRSLQEVQP